MWELDCEVSWVPKNWCFWTVVLEKTLESPLDCMEIQTVHSKGDQSWVLKEWCWSWNSSTLATSCEELTHWKICWCWERLGAGGEGDDPGWDGWMASRTRWMWVWVNSGSWWWTGRPGVRQFMGSQRVRLDWATELNWTENKFKYFSIFHYDAQQETHLTFQCSTQMSVYVSMKDGNNAFMNQNTWPYYVQFSLMFSVLF